MTVLVFLLTNPLKFSTTSSSLFISCPTDNSYPKWCVIVFTMYTSLMIANIIHIFFYLLAIFMSFLKKCLFISFPLLYTRLLVPPLVNYKCTLQILDTNPLSDTWLEWFFSPSPPRLPFILLIIVCLFVCFCYQESSELDIIPFI